MEVEEQSLPVPSGERGSEPANSRAHEPVKSEPQENAEGAMTEVTSPRKRKLQEVENEAPPLPPDADKKEVEASAAAVITHGAYALRELHLINQESTGELQFLYVRNDGTPENMKWLMALKTIFSKQLPNMPKEYICRLVLERRHRSVAVVSSGKCMGGITYRTFPSTAASTLGEIAFCAVTATEQVKGYGTRLMNWTKEYARTADRLTHFLTYADNNAVGYFAKQGFTKKVTLERERWVGFIKDYDGGTLMEFVIHPRITYSRIPQMVQTQLTALEDHLKTISNSHVIHPPLRADASVPFEPRDVYSIPGVRLAGYTGYNGMVSRNATLTVRGQLVPATPFNLQAFMEETLQLLKSQETLVWPYLKPVSVEEASDYHTIVKNPMDLQTVTERLEGRRVYVTLEIFLADLKRIWDNARLYNAADTIYYKFATQLEQILQMHIMTCVHRAP